MKYELNEVKNTIAEIERVIKCYKKDIKEGKFDSRAVAYYEEELIPSKEEELKQYKEILNMINRVRVYEELQNFLNIEVAPTVNKEAYIKSQFIRFIKANTGKTLRIYNSWDSAYQIKLHESKTSSIKGLNNIFELTKNSIEEEEKIFGIKIV